MKPEWLIVRSRRKSNVVLQMGHLSKVLFCVVLFCLLTVNNVDNAVCKISLKHDFGKPQPVFVKDGELLAPNEHGEISVPSNETLFAFCLGERRLVVLGNDTQDISVCEVICDNDGTFHVGEWKGSFKDIRCNYPPWVTTEKTGDICYDGGKIYKVGYKLTNDFITIYEACFDNNLFTTVFTKHTISPASSYIQTGDSRPQFIAGNLFRKTQVADLYKLKNQKKTLNNLLGADMDRYYLSKKQFITRGHLAPRADFPLRSSQRASFHYINAAPQWLRGNAGDWAALETAIRQRIKLYGKQVTIYTGTYGVMTLPDFLQEQKSFYLGRDGNNNNVVPVPLYFYKIIHDPDTRSAVAFVSINSSFYNISYIEDMKFCTDVCMNTMKFNWLQWRTNDGTFSFCCDYDDFSENIGHHDLVVDNLFF